ncbi:hypothetical protein JNUCC75_01055 [Bifidobacterium polysaccharolyticum]
MADNRMPKHATTEVSGHIRIFNDRVCIIVCMASWGLMRFGCPKIRKFMSNTVEAQAAGFGADYSSIKLARY